MTGEHLSLLLANAFVWGLAIVVIAAVVLVVIGVFERDAAIKLGARRDVERAALKAAGENRFSTDITV